MEAGKVLDVRPLQKVLKGLPDGNYKVEVSSTRKRSLQQNAWIHAILPDVLEGLRAVGYNEIRTTEDAKDFIKSLFFRKKISNGIDTVEIIEGTSEQTKLDFASKAEDIIIWASQYLGIDIAPPGKQFELMMADYDNEVKAVIVK